MRSLAIFVGVSLTACLIAPAKPSERGDAGGGGDGGRDGTLGSGCLSAGDFAGPAVAIDLEGSGNDTLFRGGIQNGMPMIWRFAPPVSSTACPTFANELASVASATSVDALSVARNSATFGNPTRMLFVTVTIAPDAYVLVITLGSDGSFDSIVEVLGPGMAPVPIATSLGAGAQGTDTPAFIELVDADSMLWFGGGSALGTLPVTSGKPASQAVGVHFPNSGSGSAGSDAFYGVGELTGSADHVALVGAQSTYLIHVPTGGTGTATSATVDQTIPHGNCTSGQPCEARLATRPIHDGVAPDAVTSLDRRDGAYETVTLTGSVVSNTLGGAVPGSPYRASAAVVGGLVTPDSTDMAVLWADHTGASPPEVYLYDTIDSSNPPATGQAFDAPASAMRVTRMAFVQRNFAATLLLLSDHPGAGDELCIQPDQSTGLSMCP